MHAIKEKDVQHGSCVTLCQLSYVASSLAQDMRIGITFSFSISLPVVAPSRSMLDPPMAPPLCVTTGPSGQGILQGDRLRTLDVYTGRDQGCGRESLLLVLVLVLVRHPPPYTA